ncbi:MAG: hypothetical protein ACI9HG_002247, partial [Flavobacteriales bacterium]
NLFHTFTDGCTNGNDEVSDTPACDYFLDNYGCHLNPFALEPLNCYEELINAENYMDYAGAYGCYRMFSQGQADRMYDALYYQSRFSLWQESNLIATGLEELCGSTVSVQEEVFSSETLRVYPMPSEGTFTLAWNLPVVNSIPFEIVDQLGRQVHAGALKSGSTSLELDLGHVQSGSFIFRLPQLGISKQVILVTK